MRISDWSSDVCSSDLRPIVGGGFRVSYNDAIYLKYVPDARTGRGRNYHSVYFEILGELGYVGLAIYLALLFAVWRMGSRTITLTARSEEHTSELRSLMRISYAVFCLKKKKLHEHTTINRQRKNQH